MKNIISVILLLSILSLTACDSELLPKALAAATQETVEEVKEDNDDVFAEIERNIELVSKLKERVQQSQMSNKPISLNSVVRDIEIVTVSYEKLAGQKDDIRKEILQKVAKVEKMQTSIDAEIKLLRGKKTDYTEQLRMVNDTNPDILRTRKEALTRAIKYVDAQVQLWTEFSKVERDIVIEMSDIQKRIDSFLSMIESTAIVFREGLNLLNLQRDINEAIALFASDLPRMEQLKTDMEKSWDTLDYLTSTLTGIANIRIAK